ncbi:Protein CBG04478 [Caenorhabditis briggsae]|uniref:Protein CBG04478 n=1 Tax=Caenorhabditis briggsae TaxID=6238 RepID=A8WXT0_CAEBR|nr:Protein CBG04478 [Caenorhabditis briggsae]CAP25204.1 Protein CBG04478 [Caenorhabditis briggsae]
METVNWVLRRKTARQSKRLSKPEQRQTKFTEVQKHVINEIFKVAEEPPCKTIHMISENLRSDFKQF